MLLLWCIDLQMAANITKNVSS